MTKPTLHKYFDFGDGALSNLTLPSGERVVLSIVASGTFEVRQLHLGGFVPGRRLFRAYPLEAEHMAQALVRDSHRLPPLPTAIGQHHDESALAAPADATDRPGQHAAATLDRRQRPLSLFTRLALSATDTNDLTRYYERVRHTSR